MTACAVALLDLFAPATQAWFEDAFDGPTAVQRRGWQQIAQGSHTLLLAPTGSGKTLAAFLWAIDSLLRLPQSAEAGVRILYISPLKALVYDIERNLRAPLMGTLRAAERLGLKARAPGVDIRTGDTRPKERLQQKRAPSDILVTTPESLYLLLSSEAAATLTTVTTVIVDEIHALAPTKRGVHLALSLERLSSLTEREPQRLGLSATVRPVESVARYLGGDRKVEVVDCSSVPRLELTVAAVEEAKPEATEATEAGEAGEAAAALALPPDGSILAAAAPVNPLQQGIWATLCPRILSAVEARRSSLIFVNSRYVCERLARQLNTLAGAEEGQELIQAHHGSLSPRRRAEVEEALKDGRLRAMVATSSLELGIDMGSIEQVILVSSPGSVARGLQRVGRSGHGVGGKSLGLMLAKFRGDLLECTTIAQGMRQATLEPVQVPHNVLDVLAQQLVAMCLKAPQPVALLRAQIGRAYSYAHLPDDAWLAVLDMLCGAYAGGALSEVRPHLSWDRSQDVLSARPGARLVAVLNAGTIADRGLFAVHHGDGGPKIGELDEEMVHELRRGDCFTLGASTWRVTQIGRDRVVVAAAPGEPGRLPFWRGEGPGRPIELGRAQGALVRQLLEYQEHQDRPGGEAQAQLHLEQALGLEPLAAEQLMGYLSQQRQTTAEVPSDRILVVERYQDELGDWRICVLSPFGRPVHQPWALALEARLARALGFHVPVVASDDGLVLRLPEASDSASNSAVWAAVDLDLLLPDPSTVEAEVTEQLADSALFASHFRENAGRALLLPRRRGQGRTPLWQQRLRAKTLLAATEKHPQFPIVLETYRQCLRDVFNLPALVEVLEQIGRGEIRLCEVETAQASPFAQSLEMAYTAAFLYAGDLPSAERQIQALSLDQDLLRALMGPTELRGLLEAEVMATTEAELQRLSFERQAQSLEAVADLLRDLGDLSREELEARVAIPEGQSKGLTVALISAAWLDELQRQRRVVSLRVAGEPRFVGIEEVGRYRDAVGAMPPSGLPERFVAPVPEALLLLVRRYARTHGPFEPEAPARRLGVAETAVAEILAELERRHEIVRGAFRPLGQNEEWCHVEVLKRLKRTTLAKLRRQVAAVPATAYAAFLPLWHKLERQGSGPQALAAALLQLEGLALPWSMWIQQILPQRFRDFALRDLDGLCATGQWVWLGAGKLGPRDGRVRLVRREMGSVWWAPTAVPETSTSTATAALLAHLKRRGACFTVELANLPEVGGLATLETALWPLVWCGQVTNDTVQPLGRLQQRSSRPPRPTGLPPSRDAKAWRGSRRRRFLNSRNTANTSNAAATAPIGGRWSHLESLAEPSLSPTAKLHACAVALLNRYGVVSRACASILGEEIPGGFAALYPVFAALEEEGRVRRGHFVEGLAGPQFAWPAAVEQLRAVAQDHAPDAGSEPGRSDLHLLAAVDPAQAYGALLPWPALAYKAAAKPRRQAGALLLLEAGIPWLYLEPKGQGITTFASLWAEPCRERLQAAVAALRPWARQHAGQVAVWRQIDGQAALRHPRHKDWLEAGLLGSFDGLVLQGQAPDNGFGALPSQKRGD